MILQSIFRDEGEIFFRKRVVRSIEEKLLYSGNERTARKVDPLAGYSTFTREVQFRDRIRGSGSSDANKQETKRFMH